MFRKFFEQRKAIRDAKLHERGYNWAAGKLLRGVTLDEIESHISECHYNAFDQGIEDAMSTFEKLGELRHEAL
jgi:hypothetical protein